MLSFYFTHLPPALIRLLAIFVLIVGANLDKAFTLPSLLPFGLFLWNVHVNKEVKSNSTTNHNNKGPYMFLRELAGNMSGNIPTH
jgi:hypothetical protein